jgi:hypothetical protein
MRPLCLNDVRWVLALETCFYAVVAIWMSLIALDPTSLAVVASPARLRMSFSGDWPAR